MVNTRSRSNNGKRTVGDPMPSTVVLENKVNVQTPSILGELNIPEVNILQGNVPGEAPYSTAGSKEDVVSEKENVEPEGHATRPAIVAKKRSKRKEFTNIPARCSARLNGKQEALAKKGMPQKGPSPTKRGAFKVISNPAQIAALGDPKERGGSERRKRARSVTAQDGPAAETQQKRARTTWRTFDEVKIEDSSLRTDLNEEGEIFTFEDILSSTPRERPIEPRSRDEATPGGSDIAVASTPSANVPPFASSPMIEKKACKGLQKPCSTCALEPLPAYRTLADAHRKSQVGKRTELEPANPRDYCGILSPRYFYCVLCQDEFDFRHDEELPDYDTKAYDRHARSREHRNRVKCAGSAGPPPIRTAIPKAGDLHKFGSAATGNGMRTSSRNFMQEIEVAFNSVKEHKWCLVVEGNLVKCVLCRDDFIITGTDVEIWVEHLGSVKHLQKERISAGEMV